MKLTLAIVAGVLTYLYAVWVDMTVWGWYMPRLFDLPALTFWQMAGVSLIFNSLFKARVENLTSKYDDRSPYERTSIIIIAAAVYHTTLLAAGWAISKGAF